MKKYVYIIVFILFIIAASCMFEYTTKPKNLIASDYFPSEPMIKEFSGGFENAGFTRNYDLFQDNMVQVKQEDTGTNVVFIYDVSENEIVQVYNKEVDGEFKDNYIDDYIPNACNIILKTPIKVGEKWVNDNGGEYEITGVNVKVKTPLGTYKTVEVTYTLGDFNSVSYYAKDLGLVKGVYGENYVDELIGVR